MIRPLTIGIEAQRLFQPYGRGAERTALAWLQRLPSLAPQYRFVAFVRPGADRCLAPAANLDVREVGAWSAATWEQRALPAAVAREGVDLLHCTGGTAPLRSPVPLVLTLPSVDREQEGAYRRRVGPAAVRRAVHLTTGSAFEASRLAACFPDARAAEVIAAAPADAFRPLPNGTRLEAVRARYRLPKRFVLLLGDAGDEHDLSVALKGYVLYARRVPRPLPLVVTDLAPARLLALLRRIGAEDDAHRFCLTGPVAYAGRPALYGASEAFLYAPHAHVDGQPLLDAMACRVPVIASVAGPLPELAGGAARLVAPGDAGSVAEALREVLGSPPYAWILRERGLRRAEALSSDRAARQLLTVYARALGQQAPSPLPCTPRPLRLVA